MNAGRASDWHLRRIAATAWVAVAGMNLIFAIADWDVGQRIVAAGMSDDGLRLTAAISGFSFAVAAWLGWRLVRGAVPEVATWAARLSLVGIAWALFQVLARDPATWGLLVFAIVACGSSFAVRYGGFRPAVRATALHVGLPAVWRR